MPVVRAAASSRRSAVPDYAILAAIVAALAMSGAMMFGLIPLPF